MELDEAKDRVRKYFDSFFPRGSSRTKLLEAVDMVLNQPSVEQVLDELADEFVNIGPDDALDKIRAKYCPDEPQTKEQAVNVKKLQEDLEAYLDEQYGYRARGGTVSMIRAFFAQYKPEPPKKKPTLKGILVSFIKRHEHHWISGKPIDHGELLDRLKEIGE